MLIGEFQHTLDVKGRVFMPARFRDDFGLRVVITKGLDGCLNVYSQEEWQKLLEKVNTLPMAKARSVQRFFFAAADEQEHDRQGRVLLAQGLREYAGITKDVTFIGASFLAVIGDSDRWNVVFSGITPETVAEALDELNV